MSKTAAPAAQHLQQELKLPSRAGCVSRFAAQTGLAGQHLGEHAGLEQQERDQLRGALPSCQIGCGFSPCGTR